MSDVTLEPARGSKGSVDGASPTSIISEDEISTNTPLSDDNLALRSSFGSAKSKASGAWNPLPLPHEASDDEYDTDLEVESDATKPKDVSTTWSRVYLGACKRLCVVPATYFLRHMEDESLVMKHHGIGPQGVKALSVPLVLNTLVTVLDLEDNSLGDEGAYHLCEMLKENCFINDLSLANNNLGSLAATAIGDMLVYNSSLQVLNISGNKFQDKDAPSLAQGISHNCRIRTLNLSHNKFSDGAGVPFGSAIAENESLRKVDFSWNSFRSKSGIALVEGIKGNARLRKADLSWNGLENDGAQAVGDCIRYNNVLEELDVFNNRIGFDGVILIAKGLELNETMKVFGIGRNPIGTSGASLLLKSVSNERSALQELDLTDVAVDKIFKKLHQELVQRREIKIQYGCVLSDYVVSLPKPDYAEPMRIFIKKNKISIEDFMNVVNLPSGENRALDVWMSFDIAGVDISREHVGRLALRLEAMIGEQMIECESFASKLVEHLKSE